MLNYFKNIIQIFKDSIQIFRENFKTQLVIWLMIIIQVICASYSINYFLTAQVGKYSIWVILALIILIPSFLFMYKNIFNLVSNASNLYKISNWKIIKALIILGLFNLIPFLVLSIFVKIAEFNPQTSQYLIIILNILTYIFYFSMSLSIGAIVHFQNYNIVFAILKSIGIFFKKFFYTAPVFFIIFILGYLVAMGICALIYAINLKFELLNDKLIDIIYMTIKIFPLYIIAGIYLGAQTSFLRNKDIQITY